MYYTESEFLRPLAAVIFRFEESERLVAVVTSTSEAATALLVGVTVTVTLVAAALLQAAVVVNTIAHSLGCSKQYMGQSEQ